jgi:hypothetical protein
VPELRLRHFSSGARVDSIYQLSKEGFLEFRPAFFQGCMREYLEDPALTVQAAEFLSEVGVTATTRMKYTEQQRDKLLGLFHYRITYTVREKTRIIELLVKAKTHYLELCRRLGEVLVRSGIEVPDCAALLAKTELFNTHMKEIQVFRMQKNVPAFTDVLPAVYGTYVHDASGQYMVLEEFLADAYVMKDYTDISFWTKERITKAVEDFSAMHAAHLATYDALVAQGWLGKTMDAGVMQELAPLWRAYAEKLRYFVGRLFDQQYLDRHARWIETIPEWWGRIDQLPKTLIFNDAQIRNLAVRTPETDPRLVLYDWECASIQLPQRDLVEFLSYAISEGVSDDEVLGFLDAARRKLAGDSGKAIGQEEWLEGCRLSILDFHVNRMACQLTLHVTLNRPDIERVFRASLRILGCVERKLAGAAGPA